MHFINREFMKMLRDLNLFNRNYIKEQMVYHLEQLFNHIAKRTLTSKTKKLK